MFARLFREEAGPRDDLRGGAGRAQREKKLGLHSLGVREAVSGRGWPKRRLKAFVKLLSLLYSRGCFGSRPAQETTEGLRGAVVLLVVFARLFREEAGSRDD